MKDLRTIPVASRARRWCHGSMIKSPWTMLVAAAFVLALVTGEARAGCNDLPEPGVDWRTCDLTGVDYSGLEVFGANLRNAALSSADLAAGDFREINGYRTRFVESILVDALFDGALLTAARFDRADLTGASMRDVSARDAKFLFTNLRGVDFTGANLRDADFTGADLSGAIWTDGERICAEGSSGLCR
ncbi:MAG: hypothetical protein CMM46_17850 [Rhodospirillaceae bacterium]|nr:hypothetical protein [Rhodospirillaceae bacterium]|tara:strand:- start:1898 stop:2464 length:567 start_codon:yes stop_codon:yes gene_type:complete